MVLLVQKLSKFYSKLENHHHHRAEVDVLSASLQAFRSDVSNYMNQLLSLNPKPRSETLSFPWIQRCFELLPLINKAFLKLVQDIDYPTTSWEAASLDRYLNFGLHLLELLNSVSSSLAHLSQARLSLAHGLTLVENSPSTALKHLKPIQPQSSSKDIRELLQNEDWEEKFGSCKERVINEVMIEMKSVGFWVFGVVLASLSGETKPYLEMKQVISRFNGALLVDVMDSCVFDVIVEKAETLKEVKELNNAVDSLVSAIVSGETSDAAMDLEGKLGVFEKEMEILEKQADTLFSKVLATRNDLLHGVRRRKQ
ncbi:BYPASS 1 [Hibiscus trionum]|uniref:BYPASS 1 n=1 Tax=Hibiscus trionum TaxID=183268 RepID=A0A9W7HF78_HIBTR|nr:BYPASS 1 [Hibiscus trionum]